MSEDTELEKGSRLLWRQLATRAIAEGFMPVAVIGVKGEAGGYNAALFRAHSLPRASVLVVLRQIISELEREDQEDGQRVS